jgi:proteasome lid subunit RPN8/RPN11
VNRVDVDLNNPAHPGHSDYLISCKGKKAEQIFYHPEPLYESTVNHLIDELEGHYMEKCGFLTLEEEIVRVQNSHLKPHANFYMEEEDAKNAIDYIYNDLGTEILGIYHTHPNGYPWPTPRDIRGWPNPALKWRYWLVTRGTVTEWRLVDD